MKKYSLLALGLLGFSAALFSDEKPFVFNHTIHTVGEEMACADCHKELIKSKDLKEVDLPGGGLCAGCHETPFVNRYTDHLTALPKKSPMMATLRFSHAAHAEMECAKCHGNNYTDDKAPVGAIPVTPTMASCNTCHDNRKASSSCTACHEDPSLLRPASHGPFWLTRNGHGLASRMNETSCTACHKKSDCSDCHTGRFSQAIHPVNYEYTHGLDARFKRLDCTTCHVARTFCTDCHENRK